jgi:hypothetical protein
MPARHEPSRAAVFSPLRDRGVHGARTASAFSANWSCVATRQKTPHPPSRRAEELDLAAVAAEHGTTAHHLRGLFLSLAGMLPMPEYIRWPRMTRGSWRRRVEQRPADDVVGKGRRRPRHRTGIREMHGDQTDRGTPRRRLLPYFPG